MGFNFPNTPNPGDTSNGYTWDGQKWTQKGASTQMYEAVRYDVAQGLTANQQAQARSNIGDPAANVIINGDFRINQGGYVSGAALAAGAYGHDQWKAGVGGGDYSFTQLKSSTQITIASGKSLIQPIEDVNVAGGSYVLTWTGTAQARAGVNTLTPSGAYAASPLLITGQTAGTAMSVEFNTGTLGTVKLESGSLSTPFIMRPYDQELQVCQRYFRIWRGTNGEANVVAGDSASMMIKIGSASNMRSPVTLTTGMTIGNFSASAETPTTWALLRAGVTFVTGTPSSLVMFGIDEIAVRVLGSFSSGANVMWAGSTITLGTADARM